MKRPYLLAILPLLMMASCGSGDSSSQAPSSSSDSIDARSFTFTRTEVRLDAYSSYRVVYTLEGFDEGADSRIQWKSADEAIARVDSTGLIEAGKPGSTSIVATLDGHEAKMDVHVVATGELPVFECLEKTTVFVGDVLGFNLKTTFRGEEVEATYTYSFDNHDVVEEKDGALHAKGLGKANVKITSTYLDFSMSKTCLVEVVPTVEIVVSAEQVVLAESTYEGSAYQKEITLSAKAFVDHDPLETTFTWESEDNKVATVENGLIRGVSEGETIVACSFAFQGEIYRKEIAVRVISPTSVIKDALVCNLLAEKKGIDLNAIGLNADQVQSVLEIMDSGEAPFAFTKENGFLYFPEVDDSFRGQTRTFKLKIAGETYILTVEFKDYIEDKVAFGDVENHLSDFAVSEGVKLSFDAKQSVPQEAMSNADKVSFASERPGTLAMRFSGKNEDRLTLKTPSLSSVEDYDYLVFYAYTEQAGYTVSTFGGKEISLSKGKWTRVVIDNFNDLLTLDGDPFTESGYSMKDFTLRFMNWETPSPSATVYLSSIYAGKTPKNKIIHLGEGLTPTFWWINGVYRTGAAGYEDYYAHPSNGVGLNLDDVQESDVPDFKFEENTCMEITYDGNSPTIECFFYPGNFPFSGYDELVFYVMTSDPSASEISVFQNKQKPATLVSSLVQNHWSRVCVDLHDPNAVTEKGVHYLEAENLNGFFFGFNVQGKAKEQAKFYVSSIYAY